MRLSNDQIKEAILHPEMAVREAAVWYFARSYSRDTSIMPRVIEAIRQHGWEEAFENDAFIDQLAYSDESIDWMVNELKSLKGPDPNRLDWELYVSFALTRDLLLAPPQLLRPRQSNIAGLTLLDGNPQQVLEERLTLSALSAEELWAEFEEFDPDDVDNDRSDFYVDSLTAAMAQHPHELADRIVELVRKFESEENEERLLLAICVAGEMRLEAVIPTLTDMAIGTNLPLFDAVQRALAQIGSDAIVDALVETYGKADFEDRLSTAFFLECIPSDKSVAACLKLQTEEEDQLIRNRLLQAVLMNFATEAIEPAAQFIRESEWDEDLWNLRKILLIVCNLTGERFADYDAWLAEFQENAESLLGWYQPRAVYFPYDEDFEEDEFDDEDFVEDELDEFDEPGFDLPDEEEDDESRPVTIVKHTPQVGRNDPCPCGSGKKFKKCCYHKMAAENAADATLLKEVDDLAAVFQKAAKSMKPTARSRENQQPPKPTSATYEIKITLDRTSPAVWRRLLVPDMTLDEFHGVIQVAMGWQSEHLYGFKDGKTHYSIPDDFSAHQDVQYTLLSQVVQGKRKRFEYTYDYGDNWDHTIQIERILPPEEAMSHVICLAGENACPPEDIGGVYGYADLVEVCNNPDDPRREDERYEYFVEEYDPKAFDLNAVNARLQRFMSVDAE